MIQLAHESNYYSIFTFISSYAQDYLIEIYKSINSGNLSHTLHKFISNIHINVEKLLIIIAVILLFYLIRILGKYLIFPSILKYLEKKQDGYIANILFHNFEQLQNPIIYIVRLLSLDIIIEVIHYPNQINKTINIILYILYAILIAWLIFSIINISLEIFLQKINIQKKETRKELLNLTINFIKTVIVIIILLLILQKVGVDITGFVASLGLGGLAVALAAKDTISNFFASVKMLFEEPFRQGDWIETEEFEGFVATLGFTCTKIRTFDNALITVPNTKLANEPIKNWHQRLIGRRIKFHVKLPYDSKKKNVQKAIVQIREMLINHPGIVSDKDIKEFVKTNKLAKNSLFNVEDKYGVRKTFLVYLDQLSPYSMDILIYVFSISVNWEEWLKVKQDVIMKIWDILEDNELKFAIPSQSININESKDI